MDKKEIKQYIIKLGLTIAVMTIAAIFVLGIIYAEQIGLIINNIINILMPFIIGACIAYLLAPLCNKVESKFENNKHKKIISIAVAELILVAIIVILCNIILPQSIESIMNIAKSAPSAYKNTVSFINEYLDKHMWIRDILALDSIGVEKVLTGFVNNTIIPNINSIISGIALGATSAINIIFNIIIGLVVNIFVLANRKNFAAYSKKIVYAILGKKSSELVIEEMKVANNIFSGFIVGKIIDSLIIGIICFICMLILNMPYALLVSVIVGVTNVIPFFGPFIGAIPGTVIIFSISPIQSLYFIIFIVILQQIDGNIIGPKCIGSATNLSTFWVLFSILFFGGLWGVVGMIIGVPLMAVIIDISNKVLDYILKKRKIDIQ